MDESAPPNADRLRHLATLAGTSGALVGAVVAVGWLAGVDWLKGGVAAGITMKFNAAVCTLSAGAALVLLGLRRGGRAPGVAAAVLAGFVILVGFLTLMQHVTGWDAGIDTVVVSEASGERATASPGRMGPPASTCFTLVGLAMLILARRGGGVAAAQGLGLAVCAIALLPLIGYAYRADRLFGIARYTGISVPAAAVLMALGLGVVVVRSERGPAAVLAGDDAGGLLARRLLPVLVALPILFGWLQLTFEARLYYDTHFGTSLLVVSLIVLLVAVTWHTASRLGARDRQNRELAGALARANTELSHERQNLEATVLARTRELETSYERLRRTEHAAALGTLTAGLGHDVSNLLLPIRVRVETLRAEALSDPARADVEAIGAAAAYLQRLANGLRLLARDPGEPGVRGDSVDIGEWWSETELLLRAALPRGVVLEHEIPGGLPAAAISRHQLTQAVFNLVQNAGEVLVARGQGTVRVTAGEGPTVGGADGRSLRLCISDDGPGMTDEVRRRCFEPYFSTKRRAFATGMGLAMVRSIVERAGGTIDLVTRVGHGTAFQIDLPVAAAGSAGASSVGMSVEEGAAACGRSPIRAVVSLRSERRRAYVAYMLQSLGVESLSDAGDGGAGAAPDSPEAHILVAEPSDGLTASAVRFLLPNPGVRCIIWLGEESSAPDVGPARVLAAGAKPGPGALRSVLERAVQAVASGAPAAAVPLPNGPADQGAAAPPAVAG